jgi:hypothetical protein
LILFTIATHLLNLIHLVGDDALTEVSLPMKDRGTVAGDGPHPFGSIEHLIGEQ